MHARVGGIRSVPSVGEERRPTGSGGHTASEIGTAPRAIRRGLTPRHWKHWGAKRRVKITGLQTLCSGQIFGVRDVNDRNVRLLV